MKRSKFLSMFALTCFVECKPRQKLFDRIVTQDETSLEYKDKTTECGLQERQFFHPKETQGHPVC